MATINTGRGIARRCLVRGVLGGAIAAASMVLMAASAHAADEGRHKGLTLPPSHAKATQEIAAKASGEHGWGEAEHSAARGAERQPTRAASVMQRAGAEPSGDERDVSHVAAGEGSGVKPAVHMAEQRVENVESVSAVERPQHREAKQADGSDVSEVAREAAEASTGKLLNSGAEQAAQSTGQVAQHARSLSGAAGSQVREAVQQVNGTAHGSVHAIREHLPVGRELTQRIQQVAEETVLSGVRDTVETTTDTVYDTVTHTRSALDGLVQHRGTAADQPGSGSAPDTSLHHLQGPEPTPSPRPTFHEDGPQVRSPHAPAAHTSTLRQHVPGVDASTGLGPDSHPSPSEQRPSPACAALVVGCASTPASTNAQHGAGQNSTWVLAHMSRPSVVNAPGMPLASAHGAWALPVSPVFLPGVSPD